jgi:hypothetical protein
MSDRYLLVAKRAIKRLYSTCFRLFPLWIAVEGSNRKATAKSCETWMMMAVTSKVK